MSRPPPSPAPTSPATHGSSSKLPKFLQKQVHRERSTSRSASVEPNSTSTSDTTQQKSRKTSKFLSINKDKDDKSRKSSDTRPSTPAINTTHHNEDLVDEPPVIVEPVNIPRPRTRSERPASSAPEIHHIPSPTTTTTTAAIYSSASSASRIGDLPNRLSGWFHHTFSTSSTDLSTLLAQQASSPKGKGPNALLTAAKHGKGHIDKAMRYLLDSDAMPDKCTDPIWLLGVQHPGYETPPPPPPPVVQPASPGGSGISEKKRRSSASPPVSFRSSTSSTYADSPLSQSTGSLGTSGKQPNNNNNKPDPSANWPPAFYQDFTSRIWLTYRSQFSIPIRDGRLGDLIGDNWEAVACPVGSTTTTGKRTWPWSAEKTWSSDTGWGCMLRTGQSLLANALVHLHLGRDWRRPPYPVHTADYATYVQILTWFLDTPSPEAPLSVHRMALAGKEFGTDVGQWFGPSVAAGAIRTLVSQFPDCGLAVSVATDSTLYQTQVYAASHGDTNYRSPRRHYSRVWGDRPVLLLLGIRLGIEGVNPIYYETIKRLYEFPQSVGIAGGRPGSSYYFFGSQADNLFYLDPHHARPSIPLRPRPPNVAVVPPQRTASPSDSAESHHNRSSSSHKRSHNYHSRVPTSTSSSIRYASSSVSSHHPLSTPPPPPHAPLAPSPLQQQFSTSSADSSASYSTASSNISGDSGSLIHHQICPPPPSYHSPISRSSQQQSTFHGGRWRSASHSQTAAGVSPRSSTAYSDSIMIMDPQELMVSTTTHDEHNHLDPLQLHYCTAYRPEELKTFHCERVRKMPLSGLDPSMLIGFLCRDEEEWWDFRKRVGELPKTIFSVQDELPTWPSDSDDNMGLESMSEPDDLDLDNEEEEGEGDGLVESLDAITGEEGGDDVEENDEPFFDTQSAQSASLSSGGRGSRAGKSDKGNKSEDFDTEDDPVGPITPGPGSRFEFVTPPRSSPMTGKPRKEQDIGDDNDNDNEDGVMEGGEDSIRPCKESGGGGYIDNDDDDIEDDWTDPSVSSPTPGPSSSSFSCDQHEKDEDVVVVVKDPPLSPPLSNLPSPSKGGRSKTKKKSLLQKSNRKQQQRPVPVPSVVVIPSSSSSSSQVQEHYPFPVTPVTDEPSSLSSHPPSPFPHPADEEVAEKSRQSLSTSRVPTMMTKQPRMHMTRARDGGRTQSGGVKGILPTSESV